MGYELDKLLNWYGVTSPFLSQYTGTTDADQAAYDKYVADYKNRVSNTSMYGTAGQFASNAALPATTSPIKSAATTSTYSPYTNALGQFISTDVSKPSLTTMLAKYGFTPPAANTPTQVQVNAAGQLQSQIDMEKAAAAVENAQTPITTPPLETLLPPPPAPAPVSTLAPAPVEDLANKYATPTPEPVAAPLEDLANKYSPYDINKDGRVNAEDSLALISRPAPVEPIPAPVEPTPTPEPMPAPIPSPIEPTPAPTPVPTPALTSDDIMRMVVGLGTWTDTQRAAADVNGDGKVDLLDSMALQKAAQTNYATPIAPPTYGGTTTDTTVSTPTTDNTLPAPGSADINWWDFPRDMGTNSLIGFGLYSEGGSVPNDLKKKYADGGRATSDYKAQARKVALEAGIDPDLYASLIGVESSWNPDAVSPTGVRGLAQLTKAAAQDVGVTNRMDPYENLRGGALYLAQKMKQFPNDPRRAVMAYHAGAGGNFNDPANIAYANKVFGTQTPSSASAPDQQPAPAQGGVDQSLFADALANVRAQRSALDDMLAKYAEQGQGDKSDMYLRLAAALGSPTRTGTFGETIGNAATAVAESNKGQREADLKNMMMRLEAQKYKTESAKEELTAAIASKKEEQAEKRWQAEYDQKAQALKSLNDYRAAALAAKGAPAQAKADVAQTARESLSNTIAEIQSNYDALLKAKAIPSTTFGEAENALASANASGLMQMVGRVRGTPEQTARDNINGLLSQLKGNIMRASGMSATQLNSNAELQAFERGLGDPSKSYESNMALLRSLNTKFGLGSSTVAPTPTTKPKTLGIKWQ